MNIIILRISYHCVLSKYYYYIIACLFAYRHNARRYDLNRNFPDYFKANTKQPQPETEAVKEWISKIQFVLSGSLHGGALVASYPFDNTPSASNYQCYSRLVRCHTSGTTNASHYKCAHLFTLSF